MRIKEDEKGIRDPVAVIGRVMYGLHWLTFLEHHFLASDCNCFPLNSVLFTRLN